MIQQINYCKNSSKVILPNDKKNVKPYFAILRILPLSSLCKTNLDKGIAITAVFCYNFIRLVICDVYILNRICA